EVVLTPGDEDMAGAVRRAGEIIAQNPNCLELRQFENPANPAVHRKTTGPEILEATGGDIAAFVAGVGTGGTLTGAGEVLKAAIENLDIVAVEPASSPVLSGGKPGAHAIEGIGAGFVPEVLDTGIIDEVVRIGNHTAFATARRAARLEGLPVGISSGSALAAALEIGCRPAMAGKLVV
ncbi:MAG: pyridoxal-phosphate dependent enzyme, partial [Chloroflexota bacterium]|nr:pyridoxal-phosphate dependent enzyme [Chloroflexota bacterium]